MQAVPCDEARGAVAAELLDREPPDRQDRHADEAQQVARAEPARESERREDNRHRRDHPLQQRCADAQPQPEQPPPRVAVPWRERVERSGRLVEVAREHGARSVDSRVREHERPVAPLETPALEPEPPDRRRRRAERIERAEEIVAEARLGDLRRPHCAAGYVLRLEHLHRPARVDEQVRSDEPIRPRPDDDRIRH